MSIRRFHHALLSGFFIFYIFYYLLRVVLCHNLLLDPVSQKLSNISVKAVNTYFGFGSSLTVSQATSSQWNNTSLTTLSYPTPTPSVPLPFHATKVILAPKPTSRSKTASNSVPQAITNEDGGTFIPRLSPTTAIFNSHDINHQLYSKIVAEGSRYRRLEIGPLLQNLRHLTTGQKMPNKGPLEKIRVLFLASRATSDSFLALPSPSTLDDTHHVMALRAAGAIVDCVCYDDILSFAQRSIPGLSFPITKAMASKAKAAVDKGETLPSSLSHIILALEALTGTPSAAGTHATSTPSSSFSSSAYDLLLLDDVLDEKEVSKWDKAARHLPLLLTENPSGSPIQGIATVLSLQDLGARAHGQRVAYLGSGFTGFARELARVAHLWRFSLLLSCPSTRKPSPSATRALEADMARWEHENKPMSVFYLDGTQIESDLFRTFVHETASHPFLACKNANFVLTDRFLTPNVTIPDSLRKRGKRKATGNEDIPTNFSSPSLDTYDVMKDKDIVRTTEDGVEVEQYDLEDCVLEGGKIVPGIPAYEPDEEMLSVAATGVRVLHRTPNVYSIKNEPLGLADPRCGLSTQLTNEYAAVVSIVRNVYIANREKRGLPIAPHFFTKR